MPTRSLKLRLAALFAAVATTLLFIVGAVLHRACELHFIEQDQLDLERILALIQHHTQHSERNYATPLIEPMHGAHKMAIEIRQRHGNVLFSSHAEVFNDLPEEATGLITLEGEHGPWRVITKNIPATPDQPATQSDVDRIRVGIDITHHMDFMLMFRRVLGASLLLAALASGGMGWIAARRGLAPLQDMTEHAEGISASRLGERLTEADTPPELKALTNAFNAMLGRLDDSFRRLSHFSSDIAHELRTPISNLMTQTEVALSRSRSDTEYREILHSNLEELNHLGRMIADMLFLAKADNGLIIPQREQMTLGKEIDALFDFYEALATEQGISLIRKGDETIEGDRLMIRRALSNLLSNAIRHTASGQTVCVEIQSTTIPAKDRKKESNIITIGVENPGPPIAPEHIPHIFDRFYRADPSRHKTHNGEDGSGLGLPITQSIVKAHGGTIDVDSDATRTRFTLSLPVN